jgi:hypothetical protein
VLISSVAVAHYVWPLQVQDTLASVLDMHGGPGAAGSAGGEHTGTGPAVEPSGQLDPNSPHALRDEQPAAAATAVMPDAEPAADLIAFDDDDLPSVDLSPPQPQVAAPLPPAAEQPELPDLMGGSTDSADPFAASDFSVASQEVPVATPEGVAALSDGDQLVDGMAGLDVSSDEAPPPKDNPFMEDFK